MDVDDFFDKEAVALDDQLERGDITLQKYKLEMKYLTKECKEMQDRQYIIEAGRGHLLRY